MFGFWLMLLLLLALAVALPWWPYSRGWGYSPGGVIIALLALLLFAMWMGWIIVAWPFYY